MFDGYKNASFACKKRKKKHTQIDYLIDGIKMKIFRTF